MTYECRYGVLCVMCVCVHVYCSVHCKKRGVTEHPRGAIFYCFRGNSMGYYGNSKILLPWGVPIHRVFLQCVYIAIIIQYTYVTKVTQGRIQGGGGLWGLRPPLQINDIHIY